MPWPGSGSDLNPFNNNNSEDRRRREWITLMHDDAQRWSAQTGIPAEVYLAILASETNYGKSDTYFGIKGSGTAGSSSQATHEIVNGQRVEVNDTFAKYNNPDEAHEAFIKLISTAPRYKDAWKQYQSNGNWLELLAGINAAGYATDPNWYTSIANIADATAKITGGSLTSGSAPGARSIGGSVSSPSATHPMGQVGDLPDYNADVYWEQDEDGTWIHNDAQYYQDYNLALQNQQLKQQLETGPLALYMDQVMKELSAKIEAGQLDVSKASTVLNTRLNSYKTAMDVLSSESYGYGSKVGSPYVSGREPDSYAVKKLGLSAISNAGNPVIDPLAEAMASYRDAESRMNAIPTPQVPALAGMIPNVRATGATPPVAPPNAGGGSAPSLPPPAPSADLNASLTPPPTDPAALAAWYEQQKRLGY